MPGSVQPDRAELHLELLAIRGIRAQPGAERELSGHATGDVVVPSVTQGEPGVLAGEASGPGAIA